MPRLVVLGAGESGRGVALLAQAKGWEVKVSEAGTISDGARGEFQDAGIVFETGGHSKDWLENADLIVKSPGIPWNAEGVAFAKTKGVRVIGEMEFCAPYKRGRIIGITGSNGKTTTTLLLGHLLKSAGLRTLVGGNVGTSYARLLLEEAADWYVLELSSFQLEDIEDFYVDIGMVLNLSPDHLDRYEGSFAHYAAAKYKLRQTQRFGCTWLEAQDPVSLSQASWPVSGVRNIHMPKSFEAGWAETPLRRYDLRDTVLAGPHNAANASFALTAAELAGCAGGKLAKALKSFRNADHRMQLIGYAKGVKYVNDSKATNPDAVDKALRSFDSPIIWIVGGQDKGNDYAELFPLVQKSVKQIIALGIDNSKIINAFSGHSQPVISTSSMQDAVKAAEHIAENGDIVLLSPACASFDLFRNYLDRGEQFAKAVRSLPFFTETL